MSPISLLIVKHIASGEAFFSGVALLVLAVAWRHRGWWGEERGVFLCWTIGTMLVVLSATPLSPGFYLVGALVAIAWLVKGKSRVRPTADWGKMQSPALQSSDGPEKSSALWSGLLVAVCVCGVIFEIPAQLLLPRLEPAPSKRLTVIGDSVTAGMEAGEAVTWPELLRQRHHLEVVDLSQMGATVSSAAKQVRTEGIQPGVVLLEIGGNDLLGPTTATEFERGLDDLLSHVCGDHRQVLMFELPLPPLANRFGRVQRQLARKHQVKLIPKRIFLDVLLSPSTTLDSIHLNQQGHERMSEVVWDLVREAYE